MKKEQIYLREQVKKLKWKEDINYKTIAEDLLDMNYNSFINFLHGYKDLGEERCNILKEYISLIL